MVFFLIITAVLMLLRHYVGFEVAELVAFAIIITVEIEHASIVYHDHQPEE